MIYIIASLFFSSINLGILGCIVLWQRLINIGDTLAHAIIFSLVIEYFFQVPLAIGSIIVALVFILSSSFFAFKKSDQNISMIVFSSAMIALTILTSEIVGGSFKLKDFMVGDILSSGYIEVLTSSSIALILITFLYFKFKELVLVSVSSELASVNGINSERIKFFVNMILAVSIAISIQLIGILLMTSFLIIPASIARMFSKSPKQMIFLSVLISAFVSFISLILSFSFDVGFSACSILVLAALFVSGSLVKR
jgi:zinc transport system permease protein